jgi:hypothetical protein
LSLVGTLPNDFWLFDDIRIADMQYAEDGSFLGVYVREDKDESSKLGEILKTLLAQSTPLREYLPIYRTR